MIRDCHKLVKLALMRSYANLLLLALATFTLPAWAAVDTQHTLLLDTDNKTSTGCVVSLAGQTFSGAEQRLIATVHSDAFTTTLTQVSVETCSAGSWSAPTLVLNTPQTLPEGSGSSGSTIVDYTLDLTAVHVSGLTRIGVISQSSNGQDFMGMDNQSPALANLAAALPQTPVPSLSDVGMVLLLLACAWLGAKHARRHPKWMMLALMLLLPMSWVWAKQSILAQWAGVSPIATDPQGDAPSDIDLLALYARRNGNQVSFRTDVRFAFAAPTAQALNLNGTEDVAMAVTLAGTDPLNEALSYSVDTPPSHGSLSGTAPNLTYTPAANYHGSDSFSYHVNNGRQSSASASVSITLASVPDAPLAPNQAITVQENVAQNLVLQASDPDGGSLTYTVLTPPAHGTLSGVAPNLTYTPTAAYHGTDSWTYKVNNGFTDSATATVSVQINHVNQAPTATAQTLSTPRNQNLSMTLAGTDPNNDSLTAIVVTNPAHGSLSGSAPNFTYTPANNYTGPDSLTFKVNDGALDSAAATISITVQAANNAPVAQAGSSTGFRNQAQNITLVATDPDSDPITGYTISTNPAHGSLSGSGANWTYTPTGGYTGSDSFQFTATDGSAVSTPATVSLTITNRAPTLAALGPLSTYKNVNVAATLSGSDLDGDSLTYNIDTPPAHGSLTGTGANRTYVPTTGYSGADSFVASVSDGLASSTPITVSITVMNHVPVATAQSLNVDKNVAKAITLAGTDADGDSLTYAVVTGPAHGTISGSGPNITYTPTAGYAGADSFTFKANDGGNDSAPATVSLNVVNTAPTATAQTLSTPRNQNLSMTLAGTDPNNDSLTAIVLTYPAHGSLSGSAPNFTYTPTNNYTGPDSLTFKINDGALDSAAATISITVQAANSAPVAQAGSSTGFRNQAQNITLVATDPDSDPITGYTISTNPAHGSLSGSGANWTYTPTGGYTGSDSFQFTATDGSAVSTPATVSLTITNRAPTLAALGPLSTYKNVNVAATLSGSDLDGDSLTYNIDTPPAHGSLTGTGANLTYVPTTGYSGADSFVASVSDGLASSTPITVSITVMNHVPVATAQSLNVDKNVAKAITLAGTDADGDSLTYAVVTGPAHGTISGPGPNITYTPTAGYAGADSFTFKANDGGNDSAPATVDLTVVNTAPTATGFSLSTNKNTNIAATLAGSDANGDSLSYNISTAPAHGTFTGTAPNLTYVPAHNYFGSDSFEFTVSDGQATSAPAHVDITIINTNTAPSVTNDGTYNVVGNMSYTLAAPGVLSNDSDPDDDAMTATLVSGPSHGSLSFNSDGSFVYTPNAGYSGSDSFTYKAGDGALFSGNATVSLTVSAPIWFIDGAAAAGGNGAYASPFKTITAFNAVNDGGSGHPNINQSIYIYENATPYTGTLALLNGQKVLGQDSVTSLSTLTGITPSGVTFPSNNSANATLVQLQDGINLGQNNRVAGVKVLASIAGANVGTLTVDNDVTINASNATALSLANGTVNVVLAGFDAVAVASPPANNIYLSNINGTVTVPAGNVSGASGSNILIDGGTANVSIASTVTAGTGSKVLSISNHTGGTINVTGNLTSSQKGISLTSNTGTTINVTGQVSLTTGGNAALSITGGGTVNMANAANTISTTTGQAVDISNTTIGASGVVFRSISSNGAPTAINLNTTGSSGSFSITGSGSAGSGGTLTNNTGDAVVLRNTKAPSLAYMSITNSGNDGIDGQGVNGLTLNHMVFSGNGNAVSEYALNFDAVGSANLTGTVVMNDVQITSPASTGIGIMNNSGTLDLTVTNSTVQNNIGVNGNDGLAVYATGTAVMTALVDSNNFNRMESDGVSARADSTAQLTMTISNNDFVPDNYTTSGSSDNAVSIVTGNSAQGTFTVTGNNMNANNTALLVVSNNTSILRTTINNNIIGSNVVDTGSTNEYGMELYADDGSHLYALVDSNTIRNTDFSGIYAHANDATNLGPQMDLTVTNNTVSTPDDNSAFPVGVNTMYVTANNNAVMCAKATGNTVGLGSSGLAGLRLRQIGASSTVRLAGLGADTNSTATVNTLLNSTNTVTGGSSSSIATSILATATCTLP